MNLSPTLPRSPASRLCHCQRCAQIINRLQALSDDTNQPCCSWSVTDLRSQLWRLVPDLSERD